ncbi:Pyruvate/2-oxoglutarate dehydrogenase complex, dihydrolipoamide dehydrogenase (E3) component [Monaibacterium marinum]|uniref:Pyruvate/2-oxoglutarate dehydrogenase complex, dihydrolipoamide dehydrogenase (E3) component n=1 Tax=Pontivivens marinum TaxID=1690039 RepID=A0A2C9CU84_9RHOB|nr:2Fe-2S iron-sulfur cluster-binding protein [Monaibacterium marinum]SOH94884.1 Pyruvate/2-oxoglutarate dehydrogenase complex, dihydrolipoamide dehydrogenase (E3) component [Monaibacterium marinum]
MSQITFTFDGQDITCDQTSSVAAALTQAGHRAFRKTEGDAPRGIFCGMGVCQDCLVTIDGRPNQRACMTPAAGGLQVQTQSARPALTKPQDRTLTPHRLTPRVLVIGGGAGGLNAAIAAAESGAETVLLDERKVSGGQYFKQDADPTRDPLDAQQRAGRDLVTAAYAAGVTLIQSAEVWGAFDGPEIMATSPEAVYAIRPERLIVATGAYERPATIPGWTLPGVMTVGAAQTLWRSYRTLPGRRVALFGNGPLVAQVAAELVSGGAEVVCLAEAAPAPWSRPVAALDMVRRDPALAVKGLGLLSKLARNGVRVSHDTLPEQIEQAGDVLRVTYRQNGTLKTVKADAVCLNFGFQPQNEILRLLGARMSYDAQFDQLRVDRSPDCETSVPQVYAIGDCCGLGGAPAAAVEGRIAGRAAASDEAQPTPADLSLRARHGKFQDALWRVYAADRPLPEDAPPETLICRCEEVSKATLDAALADDPLDIGALKRATRIGMGRCQGRYCAPVVAGIMARRQGRPLEDLSYFAPRIPIKPVEIAAITAAETLLDAEQTPDA